MLYSELITELRREARDLKYLAEESFVGDSATAIFVLKNKPVVENTQQVLVNGSLKTEGTHYTFDDDLGEITFTTGNIPGAVTVLCTYRHSNFNDTDWINAINNGIEVYGDKMWAEVNDWNTLDTVVSQTDYSLDSISTSIFRVVAWQYRTISSSSADNAAQWINFSNQFNATYLVDRNTVRMNPSFPISGYDIRLRALRRPVTSTLTSGTVDLDANEIKVIKAYALGEYFQRMAALKTGDTSAISKDVTVSPVQVLAGLAKAQFDKADKLIRSVRKPYPAQYIPMSVLGLPN